MSFSQNQVCFNTASLPGPSVEQALTTGREMGFRAVELLAFDGYRHRAGPLAGFYWDRLSCAERDRLRGLLDPFERVALHAPFIELHPLSPSPAIREVSLAQLEASLQAGHALGAEVVTTHAVPVPQYSYEELKPGLVDLYRWLGDLAGAGMLKVGIETGWPPPEELADLVTAVDHPRVGVTVDVGHLVWALPPERRAAPDGPEAYNDLLASHVRAAGARLVHVHVHDVRHPEWRDHALLGTGLIDWPRLARELAALGYEGLMSFELEETRPAEALRASRERLLGYLAKAR